VAPVSRQPTLHKDPFSIEASVLSEYLLIITQINYVYTGQMARSALYVIQLPVYFLVCLTTRFLSGVLAVPDVASSVCVHCELDNACAS
jgi:hypothetical protein